MVLGGNFILFFEAKLETKEEIRKKYKLTKDLISVVYMENKKLKH